MVDQPVANFKAQRAWERQRGETGVQEKRMG
jgi:hypothetical protein